MQRGNCDSSTKQEVEIVTDCLFFNDKIKCHPDTSTREVSHGPLRIRKRRSHFCQVISYYFPALPKYAVDRPNHRREQNYIYSKYEKFRKCFSTRKDEKSLCEAHANKERTQSWFCQKRGFYVRLGRKFRSLNFWWKHTSREGKKMKVVLST